MINPKKLASLLFCIFIGNSWLLGMAERLKSTTHQAPVMSGNLCPLDPNLLAYASLNNTIKVWNIKTHEYICILRGHTGYIKSISWHPTNPNLIASGSSDNTIKIWNIKNNECICTLTGHGLNPLTKIKAEISSVSWHPKNPNLLASGAEDKTVKIWDITTQQCVCTLEGHKSNVSSISWHPTNPDIIASGSWDHTIKVWDITTKQCCYTLKDHESSFIMSISWHPTNPNRIASGGNCGIRVWDVTAKQDICTLEAFGSNVISWHPTNPNLIASGSVIGNKCVDVWDITAQQRLFSLEGHEYCIDSISWVPVDDLIIVTSCDYPGSVVKIWNTRTQQCGDYSPEEGF